MPLEWNPPAPRELPALRDDLAVQMTQPIEQLTLTHLLQMGKGTLTPATGHYGHDAAVLLAEERRRLSEAELYFITADMTRLALAAADTLPIAAFHPEDVPAECGLLVFAEPLGHYVSDSPPPPGLPPRLTPIVAVSWGPPGAIPAGDGVWVTFWCPTDHDADIAAYADSMGVSRTTAASQLRGLRAELAWDNEAIIGYQPTSIRRYSTADPGVALQVEQVDPDRGTAQLAGTTAAWSHVVRAAWLLMTQPGVTEVDELHHSRAEQRRAQRAGHNPHPVRVVRIRHHADTPTAAQHTDRTYRVRWTVRGHWRNQWYPTRQQHRPIWINPHIKGPAEAPLQITQTVHLLDTSSIDPTEH